MKTHALVSMAAMLLCCGPCFAASKPQRVMSLTMCTDQLLMQLLPANRITSVTYLSRAVYRPYISAEAAHIAVNYGSPEEVLVQHPDLVIAGNVFAPGARSIYRKAGIAVLEVPAADNFSDIRSNTRLIGRAIGETEKSEMLLRQMDATLAELAATTPKTPVTVVGWDSGGNVPGPSTLFGAILAAAGATNAAENSGNPVLYGNYANFDLEQLAERGPMIVLYSGSLTARPDNLHQMIRHPALRKRFSGREITYSEFLYRCGLPQSAEAAKELRQTMLAIAGAK